MAGVLAETVLEDVVTQNHRQRLTVGEVLSQAEGLGDSASLVLDLVGEPAAKLAPRTKQPHDVAHMLDTGDDQDLFDPHARELLDGIVDHGLAPDREQMLVGHLGQRPKSRSGSARQHNTS